MSTDSPRLPYLSEGPAPVKVPPDPLAENQKLRTRWSVVAMLWCICLLNYADRQAMFSVFPKLKELYHFNPVQLGLIGSAFMWVYALCAPIAGYIADRVRRKNLILGGCLFWSTVAMSTGWCSVLWQFITVRAVEGFGETFYFPASMSLLSDYHGKATRSRALAIHQSGVYVGTIAGSWIGAIIAERYNWRYGFYLFGGLGILLALLLLKSLKEPQRGTSEVAVVNYTELPVTGASTENYPIASTGKFGFLKNPTVLLLMAGFMLANSVGSVFLTWTTTFLVSKFNFKLSAAGLYGTLFIQTASAVSVPFAGWAADRLARRYKSGRIMVQATGLIVGAYFVVQVASVTGTTALFVSMTAFGICKGMYDSGIFASLFDFVSPADRGLAAGIMNTAGWGGGALWPAAVGWLTMHGKHTGDAANMSDAIRLGGIVYIAGALTLLMAAGTAVYSKSKRLL